MSGPRTVIKKEVLQGTTPRITFQIVDEDGIGFQPDTLFLSVYDVLEAEVWTFDITLGRQVRSLSSSIVNARNDVDISDKVDSSGNVELFLGVDDTDLTVPTSPVPSTLSRRLLFTWTWDSATKVGKHEVTIPIVPDRETVAS